MKKKTDAMLREDVQISSQGKLYASPSAAAKVIRNGKSANGMAFWKYKNDAGEWVALSYLIG